MLSEQFDTSAPSGKQGVRGWLAGRYGDAFLLASLVVAGFLIRYFSISAYQVIAADGPSYISIAKEIIASHTAKSSIHYPPFYPFLIAIVNSVTRDFETAGVMVSLVMGSLLVVPVFLFGKALFGRGAGYAAAAIALVWPEFVFLSGVVLSTSTYITLLTAGLYLLWRSFSGQRYLPGVAGGVLLAAAYLTRQEAFISLAAICFCLSLLVLYQDRSFKRIKPLLAAGVTFFVLIFPYLQMVHEIMGIWTLAGKSVVTLTDCLAGYLQRTDLNRDPTFARIGYMDLVRDYPGYFPYNIKKNLVELYNAVPLPLAVFSLIGFLAIKRQDTREIQVFSAAALSPVIPLIVIFFVSGAYIAPYVPVLLFLCANGLIRSEAYLFGKLTGAAAGQKRIQWVTVALVLLYALNTAYHAIQWSPPPPYKPEMDSGRFDHKQLGKMLKKHLPEGAVIMTRANRIGFYSGHPWVDIPQADLPTIVKTAREKKVRYLVADGMLIGQRPQLAALLEPLLDWDRKVFEIADSTEPTLPGFYKRLTYIDPSSVGVIVYEFKP